MTNEQHPGRSVLEMSAEPHASFGTGFASTTVSMRMVLYGLSLFALVLTVSLVPATSRGQTVTIDRDRIVRLNSPRASEIVGGVVPLTDPVGIRDCRCEEWEFRGTFDTAGTTASVEFWVGTQMDACRSATNRRLDVMGTQCWQIPPSVVSPLTGVSGTRNFVIRVPMRWIIDPVRGACQPPGGLSSQSSVFFTALMRPPDDMSPAAQVQVTYNFTTPQAPMNVRAEPLEGGARVSWSVGTVSEDGGVPELPLNLRGFHVLCFPRPQGFDAGTDAARCFFDAGLDTITTPSDANDSNDFDATDGNTETDGTNVMDSGTNNPDTCGIAGPPPGFDPNDDRQFDQFRCTTTLLDRTATSTEIRGLTNGMAYRFAVVAQDTAGNRSVVSSLSPCVRPQRVTDFWEHYENRAGPDAARPGFCSIRPGAMGAKLNTAIVVALAGVFVTAMTRRRRMQRLRGDRVSGEQT